MTARSCSLCHGDTYILGVLGGTAHFRCRQCGAEATTTKCTDCLKPIRECECEPKE